MTEPSFSSHPLSINLESAVHATRKAKIDRDGICIWIDVFGDALFCDMYLVIIAHTLLVFVDTFARRCVPGCRYASVTE